MGGCGCLNIESEEYKLVPGTIAFVPKDTPHMYKTPKGGLWEFYWLHPLGSFAEQFLINIKKHGKYVSTFEPCRNYIGILEDIIKAAEEPGIVADLEISIKISDFFHFATLDLLKEQITRSISQKAMNYFGKHYNEPITVMDAAKALFISNSHLIKTFKKETGITPHKYLEEYRLTTAIQLLKCSNMQIDEIAFHVGYSSASHFINSFKKKYGCTPKIYEK